MTLKQNIFADMEDALSEEGGFMALALGVAFFFFLWAWLYFETFIGALLLSLILCPTISGVIALFIAIASTVLAHREGDALNSHIGKFLFALLPLALSGAFIYAIFSVS
jgi:hypothetical protein